MGLVNYFGSVITITKNVRMFTKERKMKISKRARLGSIAVAAAALVLSAIPGLADAATIGAVADNVSTSFGQLADLIVAGAYLGH